MPPMVLFTPTDGVKKRGERQVEGANDYILRIILTYFQE